MLKEMMDDIISKFGFEANETITFCSLCELVEQGKVKESENFSLVKMYDILIKK